MSEIPHPIFQLLQDDPRYRLDAYQFVREALAYAQDVMELGASSHEDKEDKEDDETLESSEDVPFGEPIDKHLTGQQLCEAIRIYAVDQFGYMAHTVLSSWGINSTSGFGDIVYNLIDIGMMKKSPTDRREDFNDVYDFNEVFQRDFKITPESE